MPALDALAEAQRRAKAGDEQAVLRALPRARPSLHAAERTGRLHKLFRRVG